MEDSIERRGLVLFAVTAIVITFGATVAFNFAASSDSDWRSYVYIAALVALMLALAASALIVVPMEPGTIGRPVLLTWSVVLLLVGIGLLVIDMGAAAYDFAQNSSFE
jgi:hypothetical protein